MQNQRPPSPATLAAVPPRHGWGISQNVSSVTAGKRKISADVLLAPVPVLPECIPRHEGKSGEASVEAAFLPPLPVAEPTTCLQPQG